MLHASARKIASRNVRLFAIALLAPATGLMRVMPADNARPLCRVTFALTFYSTAKRHMAYTASSNGAAARHHARQRALSIGLHCSRAARNVRGAAQVMLRMRCSRICARCRYQPRDEITCHHARCRYAAACRQSYAGNVIVSPLPRQFFPRLIICAREGRSRHANDAVACAAYAGMLPVTRVPRYKTRDFDK